MGGQGAYLFNFCCFGPDSESEYFAMFRNLTGS